MLCWGDVGGFVNALFFSSVAMALFDRPPAPAGEKQGQLHVPPFVFHVKWELAPFVHC